MVSDHGLLDAARRMAIVQRIPDSTSPSKTLSDLQRLEIFTKFPWTGPTASTGEMFLFDKIILILKSAISGGVETRDQMLFFECLSQLAAYDKVLKQKLINNLERDYILLVTVSGLSHQVLEDSPLTTGIAPAQLKRFAQDVEEVRDFVSFPQLSKPSFFVSYRAQI